MADLANSFKEALHTIEQKKKPDAVLAFFEETSTLKRLNHEHYEGVSGAEKFWKEYLSTFKTQETTFHNTINADEAVVLEWVSKGEFSNGEGYECRGVSILERDGDKVKAFRTYYDSAVFINESALAG